jgi:UDP-4-amino-4,6-dideoxy-N-acetyl-beta-L-altrosamine N-acetyltransferase
MTGNIRAMTATDLDCVRGWRNHPAVRPWMFSRHEITESEHAAWFNRASVGPDRWLFIYEVAERPLGFMNLRADATTRNAEWGFYTAPNAPRGTGSEMARAVIALAFAELGIHKIVGQVLDFNQRSIVFHTKLGFTLEDTLRQHHFDGATYHDVHCFGLLATDRDLTMEAIHPRVRIRPFALRSTPSETTPRPT